MLIHTIILPGLILIYSVGFSAKPIAGMPVQLAQVANQQSEQRNDTFDNYKTSNVSSNISSSQDNKRQGSLSENQVYAVIIPVHEADISSGVNATVKKIYFTPGESFRKRQKLLVFDCRNIEIDIKQAKAELKSTKTAYISNKELDGLKAISKVEFEKSKSEYEKARAEVESLNYQLSKCSIIAPYDGEVVAKHANANENVKIDDPLLSIVSTENFEVQMFVPSVWLNWLRKGSVFSLKLQEFNNPIEAKVTKIAGKIDPASQSVVIYGEMNKIPAGIVGGMSGVATFNNQNK